MNRSLTASKIITLVFSFVLTLNPLKGQPNAADVIIKATTQGAQKLIGELTSASLLIVQDGLYDTLIHLKNPTNPLVFQEVPFGVYVVAVESALFSGFAPTYYGNSPVSGGAERLALVSDTTLCIEMVKVPALEEVGEGVLNVLIEEEFNGERRKAQNRYCLLTRRTTGGRIEQNSDQFAFFTFGKTDDNGSLQITFLPEGSYRLALDYPGLPFDESSLVELEFREAGVTDQEQNFELLYKPGGIEITIVLGSVGTESQAMLVYPNPANDWLHIAANVLSEDGMSIQVLDLNGRVIREEALGKENQINMDISRFRSGIYLIQLMRQNVLVSTRKMLIK